MPERTGGDIVVEVLNQHSVRHVFAVASVHNLAILDAIRRDGRIHVVNVRHEQSAVHAADGYARATGTIGVAITSTGPGAANAMGGLFEAQFSGSPVLMLTGQVESRFYGQGRGYIHEAERQREMLRTLTRDTWSPRRTDDIGAAVQAAIAAAFDGARRPVAVEIPFDLQYDATTAPVPPAQAIAPARPNPYRLDTAARLLAAARRPLIWAGGGVVASDAGEELAGLAHALSVPVVTTTQGRGALSEDDPLCLGPLATLPPLRKVVESADVVLAVGTRFQMYPTDHWRLRLGSGRRRRLIHIDIDPAVIGRTYQPDCAVVGDAAQCLAALRDRVIDCHHEDGWLDRIRTAADRAREQARELIGADHRAIMDSIRRHLPPAGMVVRDATTPAYYWGDSLLPILRPRTSINPSSAAIGPGLPLAIGATIGTGQRGVVIHGDGGIMLSVAELATLAQERVPLTVLVFNDGGYGILRDIMGSTFGGPSHDVDLLTPDFVALAESMGVPGRKVGSAAEFDTAFAESVAGTGPFVLEIDMSALEPMRIASGAQEILT